MTSQLVFNKFCSNPNMFFKGFASNPYFFLDRELNTIVNTPNEYYHLKNHGQIRHCKILNNGMLYDYIVDRTFHSFEEWLADIGPSYTLQNIRYGVNRLSFTNTNKHYFEHKSISFDELMQRLQIERKVAPPNEDVFARLEKNRLTPQHLWVQFGSMFVTWDRFKTITPP